MGRRWGEAGAPIYLFLCLILGGSAQGVFANMLLQLLGLGLLAWAVIAPSAEPPSARERQLSIVILLALALVAIQLFPLPASLWPHLGGRAALAAGYGVFGLPVPSMPISVAPYDSIATLLTVIPPLALLLVVVRIGTRPLWLVAALLAGLFAGILLGVLQVSSPSASQSPWYLYPETNVGVATGFFANANHMATLLVISIPFLAALIASARERRSSLQHYSGVIALVGAAALVVVVGLALNGSLAGYGLAIPVVLASLVLLLPRGSRARPWVWAGTGALLAIAVAGLVLMPIGGSVLRNEATTSVTSRQQILSTSLAATRAFMPLGSGIGTFARVYSLHEDHDQLDPTTSINHAHNDYVELALETGLPGVLLIALFLLWWARATLGTWTAQHPGPFARAAGIASAAILVHSIVDFPLRTAAISSCFAMCLGLLILRRTSEQQPEPPELRPTRHVVIE
ncbi:O-antigen ligase [Sphingomonas sp. F9_3S_D5_B_2]